VYFHEDTLHETGARRARAVARLQGERPHLRGRRRLWLRTTDFGDDKDRVIIKSDGELPTSRATWRTTSTSGSAGFDR
jgi:arginyl-tRNA synthetase